MHEEDGTVLGHYIAAALWSSNDEAGIPLDDTYGPEDIAPEALEQMREDVADFLSVFETEPGWDVSGITAEQMGHDFWLTRNGHGAGFWDRGLGTLGDRLTTLAHSYGESDIYVGDDGRIYV